MAMLMKKCYVRLGRFQRIVGSSAQLQGTLLNKIYWLGSFYQEGWVLNYQEIGVSHKPAATGTC